MTKSTKIAHITEQLKEHISLFVLLQRIFDITMWESAIPSEKAECLKYQFTMHINFTENYILLRIIGKCYYYVQ